MPTYAAMLSHSGHSIVMMKATSDPNTDANWDLVGGDIYLGQKTTIKSLWSFENGSDIHVATQESDGTVSYHVFDPGTDTWTTKKDVVDASVSTDRSAVSIALRSDGDVIVLYADNPANLDQIRYARKEGGSWTNGIGINSVTIEDYHGCVVVLGASDRMHFFYKNSLNDDVLHRSVNSANVLDTGDQAVDTAIATDDFACGHGLSYVSTQTKVRVPYLDADGTVSFAEFDSGADPTISTTTGVGDAATLVQNNTGVHCASVDGTEIHWLHSRSSDSDIYHDSNDDDGGWGTDVEEKDAVTANRISCNVYDRSGKKLAYLYLDGTTSKYAEVDISGAPAALPKGSLALLGVGI